MATPDLSRRDSPFGPLRDKFSVTIGTDDYVLESGFICQVVTAGNLVYRTLEGLADQTETGLAIGNTINVASVPVVLRAVRGSGAGTTVTSIVVGRL